jgi:hypothetical protein
MLDCASGGCSIPGRLLLSSARYALKSFQIYASSDNVLILAGYFGFYFVTGFLVKNAAIMIVPVGQNKQTYLYP